jgi:hypothetical protein
MTHSSTYFVLLASTTLVHITLFSGRMESMDKLGKRGSVTINYCGCTPVCGLLREGMPTGMGLAPLIPPEIFYNI